MLRPGDGQCLESGPPDCQREDRPGQPCVDAFDVAVFLRRARRDEGREEDGAEWSGTVLGLVRLAAPQSLVRYGHPRCTRDAGMGSAVSPDRIRQNLLFQRQVANRAPRLLVVFLEAMPIEFDRDRLA